MRAPRVTDGNVTVCRDERAASTIRFHFSEKSSSRRWRSTVRTIPFFLLFVVTTSGRSQSLTGDSLRSDVNSISLAFEKNVNTYAWDFHGAYGWSDGVWSVEGAERFLRSLIRTNENLIRDENATTLRAGYRIAPPIELSARLTSTMFSDQRSLGLRSLANHAGLAGIRWQPISQLNVEPSIGYAFDSQLGIDDRGAAYDALAELSSLSIDRYTFSSRLALTGQQLAARTMQDARAGATVVAQFSPDAWNRTTVEYRNFRRDYYLPADSVVTRLYKVTHPIESRRERLLVLGDQLFYKLGSSVDAGFSIESAQRWVAKHQPFPNYTASLPVFDSDIHESRIGGAANVRYVGDRTRMELRAEFSERSEQYDVAPLANADQLLYTRQKRIEELKNNSINQTHLSISIRHAVADADTASLAASTMKMRYDTPSENNYDDRDELFFFLNAGWIHRFNRSLLVRTFAELNLRHSVYLFAQRSANNLWNRVLRFAPAVEYRSRSISSKVYGDVIANYSVYDFEDVIQSVQSYSLRQMTIGDSLSVRIVDWAWLDAAAQLRLSERGELHWSSFSIRPLQYFDERSFGVAASASWRGHVFTAGLRYFHQRRYGFTGLNRRFESELFSVGPTCAAELRFVESAHVRFDGWYQITGDGQSPSRAVPNASLSILWNL